MQFRTLASTGCFSHSQECILARDSLRWLLLLRLYVTRLPVSLKVLLTHITGIRFIHTNKQIRRTWWYTVNGHVIFHMGWK